MLRAYASPGAGRVYALAEGKSSPDFARDVAEGKKSLKRDVEFQHRLEILQGFEFNTSATLCRVSKDRKFVAAAGIYPPQVRVFDTEELGLKFSRGLDSEIVDFDFLSEDYKKLVFLLADRGVEFHAQGGRHHRLRIPRQGRCMCYDARDANLYIGGSTSDVYRIDLENGQFRVPLEGGLPSVDCSFLHPTMPLIALGGEGGAVECFDTRSEKVIARLQVAHPDDAPPENGVVSVTSGGFSSDGMTLAAGTSSGSLRLFDIRSRSPLGCGEHKNNKKVLKIEWLERFNGVEGLMAQPPSSKGPPLGPSGDCSDDDATDDDPLTVDDYDFYGSAQAGGEVEAGARAVCGEESSLSIGKLQLASCDAHSVKIWDFEAADDAAAPTSSGWPPSHTPGPSVLVSKVVASVEAPAAMSADGGGVGRVAARINDFCFFPLSGLLFVPCELKRIGVYFLPSVGVAPSWCSFLDSLTEELEDSSSSSPSSSSSSSLFDDYQFVTRDELEQLGIGDLVGTPLLRAYMHGYFISAKLYRKAKDLSEPFSFETYKRDRLKQKMEENKQMRIQINAPRRAVNAKLAHRLEATAAEAQLKGMSSKRRMVAEAADSLLHDERFSRLFTHADYAVDLSGDEEEDGGKEE
eukprot:GHVT01105107.1.p1 GENE.GHVT01105107.1~~GHVT01105107.1.p1  ORF type:complete len:634 (+),score=166.98 GHVT01105107.1:233-2134(+)